MANKKNRQRTHSKQGGHGQASNESTTEAATAVGVAPTRRSAALTTTRSAHFRSQPKADTPSRSGALRPPSQQRSQGSPGAHARTPALRGVWHQSVLVVIVLVRSVDTSRAAAGTTGRASTATAVVGAAEAAWCTGAGLRRKTQYL